MQNTDHWYLVQTKIWQEVLAEEHLQRQGYEVFLPRHAVMVKTRSGYKERVEPMFRRYLFVRLTQFAQIRHTIQNTRGVTRLVMFGASPASVSGSLIGLLQDREATASAMPLQHPIQVGDTVEVFKGAFAGFRGLVESCDASERVTLLLAYAQSYTRLTLSRNDVELARQVG